LQTQSAATICCNQTQKKRRCICGCVLLCSDAVESDLEFIGLIVFENKLKPETTPVIRELHDANIRSVMVTGTGRGFII